MSIFRVTNKITQIDLQQHTVIKMATIKDSKGILRVAKQKNRVRYAWIGIRQPADILVEGNNTFKVLNEKIYPIRKTIPPRGGRNNTTGSILAFQEANSGLIPGITYSSAIHQEWFVNKEPRIISEHHIGCVPKLKITTNPQIFLSLKLSPN